MNRAGYVAVQRRHLIVPFLLLTIPEHGSCQTRYYRPRYQKTWNDIVSSSPFNSRRRLKLHTYSSAMDPGMDKDEAIFSAIICLPYTAIFSRPVSLQGFDSLPNV